MRIASLAALVLATTACATAPPPFTVSAFGGDATLRCAVTELTAVGYDVDVTDTLVQASRTQQVAPAEANRDIVDLSLVGGDEPIVRASVTRWKYSPSLHNLPVDRQQVQPVSVDEETSTQVNRIMRGCESP